MQLTLVTPPTAEDTPVLLNDAKAFLRILDTTDDTLIQSMLDASITHTEDILNRQLGVATYELYADHYVTKLPKNPIKSIDKIEVLVDGSYVELNTSDYYLHEEFGVGHVFYNELTSFEYHKKAIKITFTCGWSTSETPTPIKHYIKTKLSTLYENREEYVIGTIIGTFDDNLVRNLLNPYRIIP